MVVAVALPAGRAFALGEPITDVKVQNNSHTMDETIQSIAGVRIGDTLETDTLETARERLQTSGLFADVNVFWVPFKDGVRINIVIKDKFPWAPVPTFSKSPGNTSLGLVVGHGNLFGRGKRGVIGGRISNVDSGALIAYDDPAFFGSWGFWNLRGRFQDQIIPEYGNVGDTTQMLRETRVRSLSVEAIAGIAWFRRVRTAVGWYLERNRIVWSPRIDKPDPRAPVGLPAASGDITRGLAEAIVTFDFRAREHAVMYGNALSFNVDLGQPRFGGDALTHYWKAGASYEHGIRFFRRHNLVVRGNGSVGEDMPFFAEPNAGGANLRGFLYRQFLGDTLLRTQVEYHFPMFSILKLDVRGVVFNDAAAIWYRKLPLDLGGMYETTENGRSYLPPQYLLPGFSAARDIHSSVGAGLRFFLRSIAVPLVGIDLGRGFETGAIRFMIVIGA